MKQVMLMAVKNDEESNKERLVRESSSSAFARAIQ